MSERESEDTEEARGNRLAGDPEGATLVPLDGVRADGWLERLVDEREELAEMAPIVGSRFVAFAFVAGVRINQLAGDLSAPDSTLVDFQVGEDPEEQRLGLNEFRRRLAAALLSDDPITTALPDDGGVPDDALLQAFLGPQTLLLAPVFGFQLDALVLARGSLPRVRLTEDVGEGAPEGEARENAQARGTEVEVPLEELRERIRDGIQGEVERVRATSAVSIDLSVLPAAEAALVEGRPERTIALLGAWPGPLTMLLRTPQAAALAPEVRATLGRALGFLGTAYVATERFDWSEETLRLGIQFVQDGDGAGELYGRLGACFAAQGRLGESIGPLRRAIALGVEEATVLPTLARAYHRLGRQVAAATTAEAALAEMGPDDALTEGEDGERGEGEDAEPAPERAEMEAILEEAGDALGNAWSRFVERFPGPRAAGAVPGDGSS